MNTFLKKMLLVNSGGDQLAPLRTGPMLTTTQEFRRKTLNDIVELENAHHIHLAKLEAVKLIDHLKKEFGL